MSGIELKTISKSFGENLILNGVDIDVKPGEFLTLVGPSGCGKSTLLRILAGLETADQGEIRINDIDATKVRPADRNLAMVFQSYALYPHLTVRENMLTPLKLRELSFAERLPFVGPIFARKKYATILQNVSDAAETLKISHLLDRKPGQLSGGQRQRVALGRAMVRKPVAFLMDEPLSNLDAALRVHMRTELAELHRALGITFVYVTHDQAEALTMSDRMAVMMGGNILQLDAPDKIYRDPDNLQVAEFVGSPKINILSLDAGEDSELTLFGQTIAKLSSTTSDSGAKLGIRPEHIAIAGTGGDICLDGVLTAKENLGSDFFLHFVVAETQRVTVRATPEQALGLSIGQSLKLWVARDRALLFDEKGARIRDAIGIGASIERDVA